MIVVSFFKSCCWWNILPVTILILFYSRLLILEQADEIPDEFPFKIQDNPGERTILLTREYGDEIIKVEVDMPNPDDIEEEEGDGNEDEGADNRTSIPLAVSISKGNGTCLEFGVTAFSDEISIDSLSVKQPEASDDQLAYEGPDFG